MKDFIFAVVFLLTITVCISSCGEIPPQERKHIDGNWGVFNSEADSTSAGDGENVKGEGGDVDVFALNAETAQTESAEENQSAPISVVVHQEKTECAECRMLNNGLTIAVMVQAVESLAVMALLLKDMRDTRKRIHYNRQ